MYYATKIKTLLYVSSSVCLLCVCNFSLHLKKPFVSYMYLGECPKIKDGRHFHGNEAREKIFFFSPYFYTDHNKCKMKWVDWKISKTVFDQHLPLTGPRNGSYTLGQVILARKLQSSCTTRTKSALTILRTASTWTRPTRHWCHMQFRSILYEGWDNKIVLE